MSADVNRTTKLTKENGKSQAAAAAEGDEQRETKEEIAEGKVLRRSK